MDGLQRFAAGLRLIARRHSARVWLLWGLAALVLVLTPFALLDPAIYLFLLDSELAATVVLLGVVGIRAGALRVVRRAVRSVV